MSDLGQLGEMKEQLQRLAAQVDEQQQTINRLQQQVQGLAATARQHPAPVSPVRRLLPHATLENLIGLRLIHLVGIIVLVIGLSLGVKYAIDANLISEKMRILLAYIAGALLWFFAARLRGVFPGFSAILFSGAMASVYFTTYAAYVYYALLPFTAIFILMVLFTFYTVFEAIRSDRQEIALLGLVGAYSIPFLISPNRGDAALLFLYIAVINAGILVLSIRKAWVLMGRLAQALTWIIFISWLVMQDARQPKETGMVFMVVFFLLFFLNAISPKLLRREKLTGAHAYQLLLNNAALALSSLFVFGYSFQNTTIAGIALFLSLLSALQAVLFHYWDERQTRGLLSAYALALFVIFEGFQWSGIVVTLLWLFTSVVLFTIGVRFKSIAVRLAAMTLMGVTLLKLVLLDSLTFSTLQKVIAYLVLGVLLLLVSYFYQRFRQQLFSDEAAEEPHRDPV